MRLYHIYRDKSFGKQFQGRGYRERSTMDPVIAMAVVIIIAKLVYGLDDKRRYDTTEFIFTFANTSMIKRGT